MLPRVTLSYYQYKTRLIYRSNVNKGTFHPSDTKRFFAGYMRSLGGHSDDIQTRSSTSLSRDTSYFTAAVT